MSILVKIRPAAALCAVAEAASSGSFLTDAPNQALAKWVANADDTKKAEEAADNVVSTLNLERTIRETTVRNATITITMTM